MKEEGVKKVNMSILETEIDLITSIKNDFAIFENSATCRCSIIRAGSKWE